MVPRRSGVDRGLNVRRLAANGVAVGTVGPRLRVDRLRTAAAHDDVIAANDEVERCWCILVENETIDALRGLAGPTRRDGESPIRGPSRAARWCAACVRKRELAAGRYA